MSKNIQVVEIRELFKLEPLELLNGLKTNLNIQFEDGEVYLLDYREIIMIRYLLQIFNSVKHTNIHIPITSKYVLNNYYVEGIYTGKSLTKWIEIATKDIIDYIIKPLDDRALLAEVQKQIWEVTNSIYNDVVYEKIKYCGTITIEDLLEVQMDKDLIESMKNVNIEQTPESVTKTYQILDDIIRHKPDIRDNQIVKGYLSESMKPDQIKQLLASRGYVTEINNRIFKYPVASSFTLGLQSLYDITVDSRAAAKALYVSHDAIRQSEYFARVLQLVTMDVSKIVEEDCGTKNYMNFYVRSKETNGKSDIDNIIGLKYLNEETNQEEIITKDHKEKLEGKFIKLRTALSCRHHNPNHICKHCFGELAYSIPINTNIGHYCSTEITEKITQSILSTKHLTSSAKTDNIKLDDITASLFDVKNDSYYIKSSVDRKKENYKLVISQDQAYGLKSVTYDNDFIKINPARLSKITSIHILVTHENGKQSYYPISIGHANRYGIFTHEFLYYITQNGYILDNQFNYNIDLTNWKPSKPIITMPQIEYDFSSLIQEFKSKFTGKDKDTDDFGVYKVSPEVVLQDCFELINSKLNINMAILAVIVYGFTVKDPRIGNYSLGRFANELQMAKLDTIMKNRSLGATYGWERHKDVVFGPRSFDSHNAVEHPMDVIIKPQEVLTSNLKK